MTDFPNKGEDQAISLRNSEYERFPLSFAKRMRDDYPAIWKAGGNIRGNSAFRLYERALDGDKAEAVLYWIKEREAWAARHFKDGSQFPEASATLSSIAGVVAAMKWGVVLGIGEKTMKDAMNEAAKKQEEKGENTLDLENTINTPYEVERAADLIVEERSHHCQLEVREDKEPKIVGYAALYDTPTQIGNFTEVIKPGAFDKVMDNDVRLLVNHDPNLVVARTASGTLRLSLDEKGLRYEATPGPQSYAQDLVTSIRRGDISGSSFAFTIEPEGQRWSEDRTTREIFDIASIADVAAVTYPAYSEASVSVRSQDQDEPETAPQTLNSSSIKTEQVSLQTNEIRRKLAELNERTEQLNSTIEADGRKAYAEEQSELDGIADEYGRLTEKLQRAEQLERQRAALVAPVAGASKSQAREVQKLNRRFSLSKAIVGAAYGNLAGVER